MALDSEEFRRKRLARQQQRARQKRRQKRLMKGLLLTATVLLLLGLLIYALTRGSGTPEPTLPSQPQAGTETTQAEYTYMTFAAGGDLNITDRVLASGGDAYDYTQVFQDVLPLLSSADLTTLNFEGNVCGEPYGSQTVSAPQSMLTALKNAGVDILQVANSRSIANGIPGLAATLANIRQAGLEPVGAWADRAEFMKRQGYSIFEVNDIRVAVIAFTKGMDGMALPQGSELCVNILYSDYASTYQNVYRERLEWLMEEVYQESPDITIALVHWGSEYNDNISKSQNTIRDILLDNGANIIIGTHSHYVHPIIQDVDAGTLVAYGLGDFLGDADRPGTDYSLILEVTVRKSNLTGETEVVGFRYTPIYTVKDPQSGALRVVRLEEAIAAYENGDINRVSKDVYLNMVSALEKVHARVTPPAT